MMCGSAAMWAHRDEISVDWIGQILRHVGAPDRRAIKTHQPGETAVSSSRSIRRIGNPPSHVPFSHGLRAGTAIACQASNQSAGCGLYAPRLLDRKSLGPAPPWRGLPFRLVAKAAAYNRGAFCPFTDPRSCELGRRVFLFAQMRLPPLPQYSGNTVILRSCQTLSEPY